MAKDPIIVHSLKDLRLQVWQWRGQGEVIGYVPTMGALHAGHISLIKIARENATKTIASIYVNPTQFAPGEDLDNYPRTTQEDVEKLALAGCDMVYIPKESLYYDDHSTSISVGAVGEGLETDHRPTFFDGVALVVTKLLNRVAPDLAVFGEKDYQQLCVIKRLVRDLDLPIKIIGAPIMRDEFGLALSSRNAYFDQSGLTLARQLNKILYACADKLLSGEGINNTLRSTQKLLIDEGFDSVDYLELVDKDDLTKITQSDFKKPARLLVVVRCKGIRLLDNCTVG